MQVFRIDHLGNTLICGFEFNQDGYEDCAIAAYWDATHAPRGGAVYLLQGSYEGLPSLANANARIHGSTEYGYGGISITAIENFSADDGTAIAIGAYGDKRVPNSTTINGAVHVFLQPPQGTLLLTDADLSLYGEGGAFGGNSGGGGAQMERGAFSVTLR